MKGKHLLLPFIAAMAFAGCSENDEPVPNDGENDLKDCGYIAVNIAQPASVGGRNTDADAGTGAGTGTDTGSETPVSGGFEAGDNETENKVTKASFFVYKDGSETCHTCTHVDTELKDDKGTPSTTVERIYEAILVVDLNQEQAFDGEIFCVLNPKDDITSLTKDTASKTKLLTMIADYSANDAGSFVMTNSSYKDGENVICGAKFTQGQLQKTEEDAKKYPVDIYVERVVAKVNATAQVALTTGTVESPYEDAPKYKIRITGIELANVANQAGLFKCINTTVGFNTTWPMLPEGTTWSFHDVDNKRCYWEFTPSSNTYTNQSYNKIATNKEETPAGTPTVYTPKTTTDKLSFTTYIQPNTSQTAIETGTPTTATSVLVTAQLGTETTDGKFTPANLVWLMGSYFSNEGAKNLLCDFLEKESYVIKTTNADGSTAHRPIKDTDLEWTKKQAKTENSVITEKDVENLKDHQVIAQIKLTAGEVIKATKNADGTYTEIKTSDNSSYSINDANAYLVGDVKFWAEVFKDGLCYYFVPIDQAPVMGTAQGSNSFYGVVRNHIYYLDLTGISGIGTAVFDPTKPIIPTKPDHDDFRYLAARVNVLKWKIVSQEIHF